MTLYYKHFTATGHPKGMTSFVITNNSWKVYLLCETNDVRSCYIFIDRTNLQVKDLSKFKTMFRQLGKHCESGMPLTNYYDENDCHYPFTFKYKGKEEKFGVFVKGIYDYISYTSPRKTNYFITCLGQTHR
jgi:hypothetical protein